ncbi:MAG: polysaccharide deacetylase family protein [Firmicutes bacterium]|nr:polysaccharide deacetylase family protein [Bacillota bacterium]
MRMMTIRSQSVRYLFATIVFAAAVGLLFIAKSAKITAAAGAVLPPQDRYSLRDVKTDKKVAALTFDLSWGTVMPEKVLAVLKKDHCAATFFLSGPWADKHADLVKQMAQDGFELESHGWAHVNYTGLSNAGVVQNIMQTNNTIEKITGQRPHFVRPPNGDFNTRTILAARSVGYTTVTWGTDSLDWMNPGVHTIISRVVTRIHPGDIVLLHASDTCKQTDLALPTIIHDLRAKGYQLVTLSQLMTYGEPVYRG